MIKRRALLRRSTKRIRRTRVVSRPKTRKRKLRTNAVIALCRTLVFDRDHACRRCLRRGRSDDQMHERDSRAKLRGRPTEEIFSTRNTIRVCPPCHQILTDSKETIEYSDEALGCNAPVRFVLKPPKTCAVGRQLDRSVQPKRGI